MVAEGFGLARAALLGVVRVGRRVEAAEQIVRVDDEDLRAGLPKAEGLEQPGADAAGELDLGSSGRLSSFRSLRSARGVLVTNHDSTSYTRPQGKGEPCARRSGSGT
jgi:hypothetical protein